MIENPPQSRCGVAQKVTSVCLFIFLFAAPAFLMTFGDSVLGSDPEGVGGALLALLVAGVCLVGSIVMGLLGCRSVWTRILWVLVQFAVLGLVIGGSLYKDSRRFFYKVIVLTDPGVAVRDPAAIWCGFKTDNGTSHREPFPKTANVTGVDAGGAVQSHEMTVRKATPKQFRGGNIRFVIHKDQSVTMEFEMAVSC